MKKCSTAPRAHVLIANSRAVAVTSAFYSPRHLHGHRNGHKERAALMSTDEAALIEQERSLFSCSADHRFSIWIFFFFLVKPITLTSNTAFTGQYFDTFNPAASENQRVRLEKIKHRFYYYLLNFTPAHGTLMYFITSKKYSQCNFITLHCRRYKKTGSMATPCLLAKVHFNLQKPFPIHRRRLPLGAFYCWAVLDVHLSTPRVGGETNSKTLRPLMQEVLMPALLCSVRRC